MLPEWIMFIKEVEGKKANLQGADLGNRKLMGANLAGADLADADLIFTGEVILIPTNVE